MYKSFGTALHHYDIIHCYSYPQVGAAAKSFIPQLQTSYLKALNDPNPPVRTQAVTGLTELLPLSPRVDPVFNELHNGVKVRMPAQQT